MVEGPEGFHEVSRESSDGFSSICVCAPLSLMGRTWGGEEGRVSHEQIGRFSSRDGIGGDDSGEDGGEKSLVSKLWWTRFQSYCSMIASVTFGLGRDEHRLKTRLRVLMGTQD